MWIPWHTSCQHIVGIFPASSSLENWRDWFSQHLENSCCRLQNSKWTDWRLVGLLACWKLETAGIVSELTLEASGYSQDRVSSCPRAQDTRARTLLLTLRQIQDGFLGKNTQTFPCQTVPQTPPTCKDCKDTLSNKKHLLSFFNKPELFKSMSNMRAVGVKEQILGGAPSKGGVMSWQMLVWPPAGYS